MEISKKKTIFVKTVVFPMRLELTTFCLADLHANHCSIEELMQLERYYILKSEKIYITSKKIAWEPGGSLGAQGQPKVLTMTFLQFLGSNVRLGIAKVAQKSLFQFERGVLIPHDQCVNLHVVLPFIVEVET